MRSGAAGARAVAPSRAASQQRLLARWIMWLFAKLVVPLLRANFYVTESEAYRYQIFYYRSGPTAKTPAIVSARADGTSQTEGHIHCNAEAILPLLSACYPGQAGVQEERVEEVA